MTARLRLTVASIVAATSLGTAAAMVVPSAAFAQSSVAAQTSRSSDTIAQTKQRAADAIQKRQAALDEVIARLGEVKALTAAHASRLKADLEAQKQSLADLGARIQAATTAGELRTLVPQIVQGHYVFAFQIPRARLVVAADEVTAVADRLSAIGDRIEARIATEKADGRDVTAAQAALDDLRAKVASARTTATSDADKVLALDASGYPGNRSVIQSARQDLGTVRRDLAAARHDAATALAALRAG